MRATSRHIKLGLLAVLAFAAAAAAMVALGVRQKAHDTYHTYFDESVQGLDEGAIVKFRGVRIGKVASISVAPDRRLIDVGLAIERRLARELQLETAAANLRTQLVIFGITGVKLIDIDFVEPTTPAAPVLTFRPDKLYIASQPSLLGSVEDDIVQFVHRLPVLIDHTVGAVDSIDRLSRDTRRMVGEFHDTVTAIGHVARGAARAKVPEALTKALTSIDDVGRRTVETSDELDQTVRDIGEAARSLRNFLDTLEREPDMILKGRAPNNGRL